MLEFLNDRNENVELEALCKTVRALIKHDEFSQCEKLAADACGRFPHAAEPHNLFGVVLELEGMHPEAMRHFRAAWALDPTFLPARYNLDKFGTFYDDGCYAIDASDCCDRRVKC